LRRVFALMLIIVMLMPPVFGAKPAEPVYMKVFQGYLGLGESVILGNYTITVAQFLYNPQTWPPVVLFKLRDNANFTTDTFSLSQGGSYAYGDVKVELIYVDNALSGNPRALVAVYSKPVTIFYGTAHENTTFSYGPIELSLLEIKNGSVFMRYHRNGTLDYAYFGTGAHYWHDVDILIYNITNESATMKVLVPRYATYSVVEGTIVVIKNVSFSPVEVGGVFNLNVTVENIGSRSARYVRVYLYSKSQIQGQENVQMVLLPTVSVPSFQEEVPFASYEEGPVKYTGPLPPGQIRTLRFKLIASKAIKPDVYPLYIRIEYMDSEGISKSEDLQVGIPVSDIERPKIVIEGFKTVPTPVEPASNFTLVLIVKNMGNAPAYHVRVELLPTKPKEGGQTYTLFPTSEEQEEADVYPIGRQSVLYFDELPVNGTGEGKLSFAVKEVPTGVYPLYAVVTYEDENSVSYKDEATFGIQVQGRPKLKVYIGNIWMSDGKYNFEVDVANDGKAPARGVTVSISSPVLSLFPLGERYVGSVEPMDYDSVNFMVLNETVRAGSYPVVVRVTYMTINGSFTSFNETIELQLPSTITKENRSSYYYAAGVAVLVLIIALWRLRRG
jgi:hypothetical protein